MHLVKVGPSLAERCERLINHRHRAAVVARLTRFREATETELAPEPWTLLQAPLVLLLADVCDALGLSEEEKDAVLGEVGQSALNTLLETPVTVRSERLLNERQVQALRYVRQHGVINQGVYRQLYPHLSSETLRLDLADLVTRGLLHKHGNCRGTYYTPR